MPTFQIIAVNPSNIDQHGVFCVSNPKYPGYQRKLDWLKKRFREGLRFKLLYLNNADKPTAFIEYIPGEHSWRAVHAPGYFIIHCIWTAGKSNYRKGYATALVKDCIDDARRKGMHGVAVVTSDGPWCANQSLFHRLDFEIVDTAPPALQLMAIKLKKRAPNPAFPTDWDRRLKRRGKGLTLMYSDQCPFLTKCIEDVQATAADAGLDTKLVHIKSAKQAQGSPTPYGTFCLTHDGELWSYHYVSGRRFHNILQERDLA